MVKIRYGAFFIKKKKIYEIFHKSMKIYEKENNK